MRTKLVFDSWQKECKSIEGTEKNIELTSGDFHSGTTWDGTISLPADAYDELMRAIDAGYQPHFWISEI